MSVTTARVDMKDVYLYILTHDAAWQDDVPSDIIAAGFKFSEGDFTYNLKRQYEFIPDRGRIVTGSVREGDEVPMEISFQGEFQTLFGEDGTPTAYEILMGEGDAAAYAGLGDNACEPYATSLFLINDPIIRLPGCGEGEGLLFQNFFCEGADIAVKAGTISFQGKCKSLAPERVAWNDEAAIVGWTIPSLHLHGV